jgi:hypothetical protein
MEGVTDFGRGRGRGRDRDRDPSWGGCRYGEMILNVLDWICRIITP